MVYRKATMAFSNNLRVSGLLHGGNFQAWKERITAMLQIHGVEHLIVEQHDRYPSENTETDWVEKFRNVASFIRLLVNPELLQRVPKDEQADARRLMQQLERIACHFRFLDLPAEVRNRIYGYILTSNNKITIIPRTKTITGYPAITKVSRLTRGEVLPLFYASTIVELSFVILGSLETPAVAKTIRKWAEGIPTEQLKHLTAVTVLLTAPRKIQFTFTTRERLRVDYPSGLNLSSKNLLDAHAGRVRKDCDLLGIQDGRAIFLALATSEAVWKSGNWQM